jgi:hypothetical protein
MHASVRLRTCLAGPLLLFVLIGGCAGNGEGLDENGRPIGEGPPPGDDDFTVIQTTIFTPVCTACHSGAQAPQGLRLDEGNSYAMLVDVPSVEVPELRRVAPGEPDNSYLVQKIEGRAAVGERMPLGGPSLDTEQIDLIRQWIAAGAQPPPTARSTPLAPARLISSAPAPDELVTDPAAPMMVVFSRALDANLLLDANIILTRSGGDGRFDDGNEVPVAVRVLKMSAGGSALWLRSTTSLPADRYELRLRGSGPVALADLEGRPIDGDGDGAAGGDAVLRFKVAGIAP